MASNSPSASSAPSARAVFLGLGIGLPLAGLSYVNDALVSGTPIVSHYLPLPIYGGFLLLALVANPLLRCVKRSWALRPGELAVMLCIVLASGAVASNGMIRSFAPALASPAENFRIRVEWDRTKVIRYLPRDVVVADGRYDNVVIGGYYDGVPRSEGEPFGIADIPWGAWRGPLTSWLPPLAMLLVAGLCLAVICQRQWARREWLTFPIANLIGSIFHGRLSSSMGQREDQTPIYRRAGFWVLLALAFGVHLANGLHTWFPTFIEIPLQQYHGWLVLMKYPLLRRTPFSWIIFMPTISFLVVGFSFFVAKEVSLTFGLGGLMALFGSYFLLEHGVNLRDSPGGLGWPEGFFRFGACLGIAITVLYAGRSYYRALLARAVFPFLGAGRRVEGVWTARAFLFCCAAAVAMLCRVGIDWPLGILVVGGLLLVFMVMARLVAEAGMFVCTAHLSWTGIAGVLGGLFGFYAIGPQQLLLVTLFVLLARTTECTYVTPLVISGLEVCRREKVPAAPVTRWMILMLLAAIPIGLVVSLYLPYSRGLRSLGDAEKYWASQPLHGPGSLPFDDAATAVERLKRSGTLAESESLGPLRRLAAIKPMRGVVKYILLGLGVTLVVGALRFRLPWWPLHPLVFVVWGSWTLALLSFSFLLGWAIRTAVATMGGKRAMDRAKPMMIGLMAGELLGAVLWIIVGWVYHLATGLEPPTYKIKI